MENLYLSFCTFLEREKKVYILSDKYLLYVIKEVSEMDDILPLVEEVTIGIEEVEEVLRDMDEFIKELERLVAEI